jgi:hypothetical protein
MQLLSRKSVLSYPIIMLERRAYQSGSYELVGRLQDSVHITLIRSYAHLRFLSALSLLLHLLNLSIQEINRSQLLRKLRIYIRLNSCFCAQNLSLGAHG